ncbi:MAG: Rrf2 family transcriptional regulator [Bdellovibrionales bacterium]
MNRLNRKVEYALMALKVMSQKRAGELTSAKEVTDQTGCPFDATARVLQQMAQKGILRSEHGAHGGYLLIRDLARVSVAELMEVLLGPMGVVKCLLSDECGLRPTCNIISPVSVLNRKLVEFYQDLTVGELLRVKDRADEQISGVREVAP